MTRPRFLPEDKVRVLKEQRDGRALVDGVYLFQCQSRANFHCVRAGGDDIFVSEDHLFPLWSPIRLDKGAILITSERGRVKLHGPLDADEEARFCATWNGKLGLTILARVDLAACPVTLREGQGLDIPDAVEGT